ncbi:MAG: hypothetical protein M5U09_27920 [Gammaproteobacteria bacterium]|nr:hypothetical protein [Gammaproteobacteria bacterium]
MNLSEPSGGPEILDGLLQPVPALVADGRALGLLVGDEIVGQRQLRPLAAVERAADRLVGAVGFHLHAVPGHELAHLPHVRLAAHLREVEREHRVHGQLQLHHLEQLGRQSQLRTQDHHVVDDARRLACKADLPPYLRLAQQRLYRAPHRRDLGGERRLGLAARRPPPLAQAAIVAQDPRHPVAEVRWNVLGSPRTWCREVRIGEKTEIAAEHPRTPRRDRALAAVQVELVRLDLAPRGGDKLADLPEELCLVQLQLPKTSLTRRLKGSSISTHSERRSGCFSRMKPVSSSITS